MTIWSPFLCGFIGNALLLDLSNCFIKIGLSCWLQAANNRPTINLIAWLIPDELVIIKLLIMGYSKIDNDGFYCWY
ncbi:hypothetical protein CTM93_12425 [Photobacterium phosphoreum]|nr:hypothetical protein CTM93_12425 [Photobacterium phosphoreum]